MAPPKRSAASDKSPSTEGGSSIKLYYTQKRHQTEEALAKSLPSAAEPVVHKVSRAEVSDVGFEEVFKNFCPSGHDRVAQLVTDELSTARDQLRLKELDDKPFKSLIHSILKGESERLSSRAKSSVDFTAWLEKEGVLTTFLACYLVYQGIAKPDELEDVSAFDALLLIEPVVRCTHPRLIEGIGRLKKWEETLMLSAVWSESRIYELIEDEKVRASRSKDAALLASPRKAVSSMTSNGPSSSRVTPLELFFRKYFRLVLSHIDQLAHGLDLGDALQEALWQAFLGMVERVEPTQRLLHKRHLYQILAALTYSVCKFYDKSVTFKQIIGILQGSPSLYKQIWMGDEGEERVDVVTFYNAAFLPAMHQVIHSLPALEIVDECLATVPASPDPHPRTPRRTRSQYADPTHSLLQQPSLHSPLMNTAHLSSHVQLSMSPLKHSLSRHIASTGTPTKLQLDRTLHLILEQDENASSMPLSPARKRPAVSRRLAF